MQQCLQLGNLAIRQGTGSQRMPNYVNLAYAVGVNILGIEDDRYAVTGSMKHMEILKVKEQFWQELF